MDNSSNFFVALLAGGLIWLLVSLLWPFIPFVQKIITPSPNTNLNIEGLRGYLAFGVFLHHAIITKGFFATGKWEVPTFHPSALIGEGGVALFFIITAFLFWGKVISSNGKLHIRHFLKGRLLRLAPLYLSVATIVIVASLAKSGFVLNQPLSNVVQQILRWLALGILGTPAINGIDSERFVAGVFWSLQYEWAFYLTLPLLAGLLLIIKNRHITIIGLLLLFPFVLLHSTITVARILLFVGGMLCAHLWSSEKFREWQPQPLVPQIIFTAGLLLLWIFPTAYGVYQSAIFTIVFASLLKLTGTMTLGKVIRIYPARALGAVSYSVYMVHGLILYFMSHVFKGFQASFMYFFIFLLFSGMLLVFCSLGSFAILEYPFFRKGRRRIRAMFNKSESRII